MRKPLALMTVAELAAVRRDGLPIHCQTIKRPSVVDRGRWIYSDIEETGPDELRAALSTLRPGWLPAGPAFIRTRPPIG